MYLSLFVYNVSSKTIMRLQIVRFLETFRQALSWINTEVLFLNMFLIELLFIFSFITCHSRILQCVEFKNFCSFAVCCSFSITWIQLNTAWILRLRLFSVVYFFFNRFIRFSLKKWAYVKNERVLIYSKTDRLAGFSSPSLSFFFNKKKL